jgi:hypothetical protein
MNDTAAGDPVAGQPLQSPVNSIVAAASTAYDLDTAHQKSIKAKSLLWSPSYPRPEQLSEIKYAGGAKQPPFANVSHKLFLVTARIKRLLNG